MDNPRRITIEPTNHCNLSCIPCPRHYIDMPFGYMSWSLFARICDQIPKSVTDIILAWRGEPTLHPELRGMIVRCPVPPVIATNGVHIAKMSFSQIKAVNLSIHTPEYLNYLPFMPVYTTNRTEITVSRVAGEISDAFWRQVKEFGNSFAVKIQYRTYQRHSEGGVWGALSQDGNRFQRKGQRKGLCPRLKTDLVIAWDGSVSRCCYCWETVPGLNANNMTLHEIWNSPQLQEIRGNYPDEICSHCDQWRTERTL